MSWGVGGHSSVVYVLLKRKIVRVHLEGHALAASCTRCTMPSMRNGRK